MNTTRPAAIIALAALFGPGCYAYAGPPRHTHERVVVHERPRPTRVVVVRERRPPPPRVIVRERVVERGPHRPHRHHDHD